MNSFFIEDAKQDCVLISGSAQVFFITPFTHYQDHSFPIIVLLRIKVKLIIVGDKTILF